MYWRRRLPHVRALTRHPETGLPRLTPPTRREYWCALLAEVVELARAAWNRWRDPAPLWRRK